jgi:endonuclease/exonuclease/phosphatase family metal-dependent hydrolase
MTWNVHGTFKLNPRFDIDGVCAIIEKWAPDIVALQEVDSRGRSDNVFGRLADSVGEHRVEARSIIADDGHYGQVLLSRWPFVAEPKIADVSYQERAPGHLCLRPFSRRRSDCDRNSFRPECPRAIRAGAGARGPDR